MNVDANAVLTYIFVAFGGFLVKYIWDAGVKAQNKKDEKAAKYDKQELQETVEKIVKESCLQFKSSLEESINDFKTEATAQFEHYRTMY